MRPGIGGDGGFAGVLCAIMRVVNAPKLIVDALLQRFLPLARRRVDTAQAQVSVSSWEVSATLL